MHDSMKEKNKNEVRADFLPYVEAIIWCITRYFKTDWVALKGFHLKQYFKGISWV